MATEKKYIITEKQLRAMASKFEHLQTNSNGVNLDCMFLPLAPDLDAIKAEILERRKNIERSYEMLHPDIRDVNCYGMQVLIAQLNGFLSLLEGEKP